MSTFLQICNQVSTIIGLQGIITDVENPIGIQKNIVEAVKSEWVDLQNLREDWTFMEGSITSFSTVQDQITYTPTEVFGSSSQAALLGLYKTKRGIWLEYRTLTYIQYEDLPYVENTIQYKPQWYSYNPANNNLILQRPNGIYNLDIRYRKAVQTLAVNGDTPYLNSQYHNAIAYLAAAKVFTYLGNQGSAMEYKVSGNRILGQIMRTYLRSRTVYPERFVI